MFSWMVFKENSNIEIEKHPQFWQFSFRAYDETIYAILVQF